MLYFTEEKVELVNTRIEQLHFELKVLPLNPQKSTGISMPRMCYSREYYKPESGMIHLEDFSWREQQIQGPLWDEFQRTHILSPLS